MKHREVVETWTGPGATDEVIVPLRPDENGAHPSMSRNHFEHWYFDAILEDGHVVVGFLQTAELITRKPGVELHVYKPSGEKISNTASYPASEVSASESGCDVRVGASHAHAEYPPDGGLPVHHVHIAEGDATADLTFTSELPGWKPGGGRTEYGDDEFFAWVVPAPRARVEGTVTFGGKRLDARGIGYHDHNWGIGDMKRIVSYWYWGRIYAQDVTVLYAYVMTKKRYGNACSTPMMVAYDGKVILSTGEMTLRTGEPVFDQRANRDHPSFFVIEALPTLSLRLDVREVIDAHNLLHDVSPIFKNRLIERAVNAAVGRPGYFRFGSDFSLHLEHRGTSLDRSGRTLHEMVALE